MNSSLSTFRCFTGWTCIMEIICPYLHMGRRSSGFQGLFRTQRRRYKAFKNACILLPNTGSAGYLWQITLWFCMLDYYSWHACRKTCKRSDGMGRNTLDLFYVKVILSQIICPNATSMHMVDLQLYTARCTIFLTILKSCTVYLPQCGRDLWLHVTWRLSLCWSRLNSTRRMVLCRMLEIKQQIQFYHVIQAKLENKCKVKCNKLLHILQKGMTCYAGAILSDKLVMINALYALPTFVDP